MQKVAFVGVHNVWRSQNEKTLGKQLMGDVFAIHSAGAETKDKINPDAVQLMK